MIKAVIFDMNGIIINDEHIHENAFTQTVKPYGINLTHQAYLDCCAGKTDEAGYRSIAKTFGIQLPIAKLLKEKSGMYLTLFPTHKKDYPGIINLIHSLKNDFTLALTSSSSRKEIDLIIKEFDIHHDFSVTISADDITKGKPDPEPYLVTAQKLKVKPEGCVVIEDSKSGVISAKLAGCFCIAVTTTHSKEDLSQADVIVDSFDKINVEMIRSFKN